MLIRFGYDITVSVPQDTPMITMMSIRDERRDDIRFQAGLTTAPPVPCTVYRDLFGNTCRRFVAPAGVFSIRSDSTIETSGDLDPVHPDARETPIAQLPDDTLMYLLGSRYCETDRLSQLAWDMFGQTAPGWARVQAICDRVMPTSGSTTSRPAPPAPPSRHGRKGSASAAISPTSPSLSAAA